MREHLGCGLPPRLILEIDVRERLSIVVTHDERRRVARLTKVAGSGAQASSNDPPDNREN
jgi:hypothetical protein